MSSGQPIGVFDSGVGGLSVLRDIRRELANENLIYVADSVHAPYGDKSTEFIEARSIAITRFLLTRQAKAIVVACNTATSAAVSELRARFSLPIVAMEPAVKPAVEKTVSGVVGVMATRRTVASSNFLSLLTRYGTDVDIVVQPCPGLVEQVEAGALSGEKTRFMVRQYLLPLLERGADTIVLGCTHYPFLAPLIKEMAGPGVSILDPGEAIARELRRRLESGGLLSGEISPGEEQFWTSDASENAKPLISRLWQKDVDVRLLPDPYRKIN